MARNVDVKLSFEGAVATLLIDRPDSMNAIALATMIELNEVLAELERSDAHVLVVRGAGDRVFVSGGDLKELSAIRTHEAAQEMALTMRRVLDRLSNLPIPVLGVINGSAFGGGAEVAIACDMRLAASGVRIAFNQVSLGIMPAWGGIERLTACVGSSRALMLMTTGTTLDAEKAEQWGLFDEVVPRDELDARAEALAASIAQAPRSALVGIKAAQRASQPASSPHLAEAATGAFARTWVAPDHWRLVDEADTRRRAARAERVEHN